MSEFKAKIIAELDTSKVEQQINDLNGKKVKFDVDTGNTQKNINSIGNSIKSTAKTASSFSETLKKSLNIGAAATIAREGFQLIRTAANNAIESIKDLNGAIVDLQMATGQSYNQVSKLVGDYNEMAKSLGATTTQVTEAADSWLRQGNSLSDTNTLIRDSMILSKVGQLDSAAATQYLTSSMKGYKVAADDALGIVDKLTAVDLESATNAGGLAEAMSEVAATASNAGISMDKLLGYLAATGEVTQESMSTIGTSFKTIFTRMSDIKSGKLELIDEDGTTEILSDVEQTLANVGIDLRKTVTEYNNYGDVLDNLAAKWDSLSQVQQNALAKAFAGTRQQNRFRVLMENYDNAKKYMDVAANSAGTAESKFSAYLDGIESKINSLQAAFESLVFNSSMTEIYSGIVEASTAVLEFLDNTKLLQGALEATIKEMQNVKGKAKVDASEVEYANQIIEYCVAQQQNLSAPIVMSVDTSAISEKNAEAIEQIQEFKRACNDLELKQKLGVDTSDAQSKVNTLATDIKNIDPKIAAELSLDTSSVENLKTSINNITGEQLVKIGIDDSAIIGWTADNKTAKVTYDVDSTAVDTYKKQDDSKTATVTYHKISTEVDQYNPSNLSRTVTYHIKTEGSVGVNGTANVTGTAMAGGNWGAKQGGNTLVGELGREIVVDPHTGRWYTVGDTGAEFVDIPKGSIVFNHKQTESLLANGYVAGRASALVNGTAMVTGGIKRNNAQTSTKSGGNSTSNYEKSSSSKSSSSSSKSSSKSSEEEKEPQIFDWIEIALSRIQRAIDNLSKKAESTFKKLSTRLSATNKEISKVNEEINLQQKAADRYMKEANNVGLSSALAKKVREGTIDINEYDEDTQKLIEDYQKWYNYYATIYSNVY